jgi:SAM-dependent methyltransferase
MDDDDDTLGLAPRETFANVLDFGCGCGRLTRVLLKRKLLDRYLGIDVHRGMISWCEENLVPLHRGLKFEHHDVHNPGLNPASEHDVLPLPGHGYSLVIASSVFTHLPQRQAEHYIADISRVLAPNGALLATFFFFDKSLFPMMQPFQHALYVNQDDPTNAVLFTREWLLEQLEQHGLATERVLPPPVRHHQWRLLIRPRTMVDGEVQWPKDDAPAKPVAPPTHEPPS